MTSRKIDGLDEKKDQTATTRLVLPYYMTRHGVEQFEVASKPATPPEHDSFVFVTSNLYKLNISGRDIRIYCYAIKEYYHGINQIPGDDPPSINDVMANRISSHVRDVISTNFKKFRLLRENDFFVEPHSMRLYTLRPLPESETNPDYFYQMSNPTGNVSVVRDGVFQLNLLDLLEKVHLPNLSDALLDGFVNTAINNFYAKRNDTFQLAETYYPNFGNEVCDECFQLVVGMRTTVERVEGEQGQTPAVALNIASNWFYQRCNLLHYLSLNTEMTDDYKPLDLKVLERRSKELKGVTVVLNFYRKFNPFLIVGISWRDPTTTKYPIPYSSNFTTVAEHLWYKHGIELQYPDGPLVELVPELGIGGNPKDKRAIYYPAEVLDIVLHQRVGRDVNIVGGSRPAVNRLKKIQRLAPEVQQNARRAGIGLDMAGEPLTVKAGLLKPPELVYEDHDNTEVTINPTTTHWRWPEGQQLARPANTTEVCWGIFVLSDRTLTVEDKAYAQEFGDMLHATFRGRGIELPLPNAFACTDGKEDVIEYLRYSKRIRYILFVMSKKLKAHDFTKIAVEHNMEIIAQTVTLENAAFVVDNPENRKAKKIVENVMLKMNVKLGGLNHKLSIGRSLKPSDRKPLRLFVGLTLRRGKPTKDRNVANCFGASIPSVVGFSANCGKDELDFNGDFFYQYASHDSKIRHMDTIMREICKRFAKVKGAPAEEIYVYRNLEDFEYHQALNHEIPALIQVLEDNLCGDLVYIATTRYHNVRFFPKEPDTEKSSNLAAGTVIDSVAVDADLKQFYLTSANVSSGTTLPRRYTVLSDTRNTDLKDLEKITYDLTFAHQTSLQSSGTPAPFTVAKDYARRGVILAQELIHNSLSGLDADLTVKELNRRLRYSQTNRIKNTRVTA